ncbi:unnamed protein product [Lampetra fluviatilis]
MDVNNATKQSLTSRREGPEVTGTNLPHDGRLHKAARVMCIVTVNRRFSPGDPLRRRATLHGNESSASPCHVQVSRFAGQQEHTARVSRCQTAARGWGGLCRSTLYCCPDAVSEQGHSRRGKAWAAAAVGTASLPSVRAVACTAQARVCLVPACARKTQRGPRRSLVTDKHNLRDRLEGGRPHPAAGREKQSHAGRAR